MAAASSEKLLLCGFHVPSGSAEVLTSFLPAVQLQGECSSLTPTGFCCQAEKDCENVKQGCLLFVFKVNFNKNMLTYDVSGWVLSVLFF